MSSKHSNLPFNYKSAIDYERLLIHESEFTSSPIIKIPPVPTSIKVSIDAGFIFIFNT